MNSHRRVLRHWQLLALLFLSIGAAAQTTAIPTITLSEVTQGSLLLRTEAQGTYELAPTQQTDVVIRVTGPIARASVRQTFRNSSESWQEAVYAFPLPEDAAVDRMKIYVGDRVIEGVVREREKARKTYEQARDAGKRSALVEQHRPNLFTTSVANIPPGGEVRVEIAYQQPVAWRDGRFGLRFPMAVTPRYRPARSKLVEEPIKLTDGWAILPGEVPNAVPLAPQDPLEGEASNRVRLTIELDAGFPLDRIESRSHAIVTKPGQADGLTIHLAEERVPADRDFLIDWAPEAGREPRAAYFVESDETGDYGLLMIMPPYASADVLPVARETVFVIDTSGSMGGASIRQARAALATAIERLQPQDRFNVVQFNSSAEALFARSREATAGNRLEALRYVANLEAEGGTEVLSALREAFALTEGDHGTLLQIVFITDGAVGNEAELLAYVHEHLGRRRLFTVGIGSAPNGHFMTEAAYFGRGTFTYIARPDEVQGGMTALLEKLEQPMLTDATLDLAVASDLLPDPLPDLYAGEPIVAVMKLEGLPGEARIDGRLGTTAWSHRLELQDAAEQSGIGVLWAREKIRAWTRSLVRGAAPELVKGAIVELALNHNLVSRYTSLVAVDVTPVRPAGASASSHALPGRLPAGWEAGPISGAEIQVAMAQGSTSSRLYLVVGLGLVFIAGLTWRFGQRNGVIRT